MRKLQKTIAILAVSISLFAFMATQAFANGSKEAAQKSSTTTASSSGGFHLASWVKQDVQSGKQLKIDLVFIEPSAPFGQQIAAGMRAAGKKYNVNVKMVGPTNGSADQEIKDLQDLIVEHVDGIGVADASASAMNRVINQAYSEGIPIITFNTDAPGSKHMAYIGQSLYNSGVSAGKDMVKYLHGKGSVIIFSADTGAIWSTRRIAGFKKAIASHPGIHIVTVVNTGLDSGQIYPKIDSAMLAHPNVSAIYCIDSLTTPEAGVWIDRHGKIGVIKEVGFDLVPQTLTEIQKGAITESIGQYPYYQGYDTVQELVQYLKNGKPLATKDTGAQPITAANLAEYKKNPNGTK